MARIKSISKERLALIQLADAVSMLNKGNYISSVTLAGAAEEILGKFSKNKKALTALEIESFLNNSTTKKPKYQLNRNLIRNELKHIGESDSINIDELMNAALMHISAAIINYKLCYNKLPNDPLIQEYCKERGIT